MASKLIKRRRQPQQQPNGLWLQRHEKKQKLEEVVVEEANISERRSWADMDHDILVSIMMRLSWWEYSFGVCYVCKSWLSALLDVFFPPVKVLDLRPIDSIPKQDKYFRARFRHYMKLMLDRRPPTQYTKVIFARSPFKEEAYMYIAQRLPSLNCCMSLAGLYMDIYCIRNCLPYWKNLKQLHCHVVLLEHPGAYYECLHSLSLFGRIGNKLASLIAENFPLLKRLLIACCGLSVDALSIILDSHKNLIYLDTRHCYRLEEKDVFKSFEKKISPPLRALEWNEEEIKQKAAGIKKHLQCARKYCVKCSVKY